VKTQRLYYDDAYQNQFSAEVVAVRPGWVQLDRTAFYPEGGGQPADQGWLNELEVTDTQADEQGAIWHQVAEPIPVGAIVTGRIDWPRRFDHMQQHSGQHVLSQAFWQLHQAATVGFHLGEQLVTIDLDRQDLTDADLLQVEELANAVIRSSRPVMASFVTADKLPLHELRKLPKVTEDIRLVAIANFDVCPCGGTHVRDLGDVGLLKLLSWEKRRGNLRVSFIAGKRAYEDYRDKHLLLQQLSSLLSQPVMEVDAGVTKLLGRVDELEKQLKLMQTERIMQEAERLLTDAPRVGSVTIVCQQYDQQWTLEQVKDLVAHLVEHDRVVAMCAIADEHFRMVLGMGAEEGLHAGNLLRQVVVKHSGKGGGSPNLAQGMVPLQVGEQALLELRRTVLAGIKE